MIFLEKIRQVPFWVWLITAVVIGLLFLSPSLWIYYHHEIERPNVVAAAKSSGATVVSSPAQQPREGMASSTEPYDLLLVQSANGSRSETYYAPNGDKTVVTYRNDAWQSTSTEFRSRQVDAPFFIVGMFFFLLANVVHIRSTGDWMILLRPKLLDMPPLAFGLSVAGFAICTSVVVSFVWSP